MNPTNIDPIRSFLRLLLIAQAPSEGVEWIQGRLETFQETGKIQTFYLTFSAVPRYLGKEKLQLGADLLQKADELRGGFNPVGWTADRLARVFLLLNLPHEDADSFIEKMEMLFDTADMGELVALYSSLPLLPYPEKFTGRAAEGIRTNMTNVFDAIALDNPYPADYLSEDAWNQMVLKAAFLDRPIYRIHGLERRANAQLADIISDYAHERWAAGRVVSPEFWRPVGRFLNDRLTQDIIRLFSEENPVHHKAAALVCSKSDHPAAKSLLEKHPALKKEIGSGALTWDTLAMDWWEEKKSVAVD